MLESLIQVSMLESLIQVSMLTMRLIRYEQHVGYPVSTQVWDEMRSQVEWQTMK